MDNGSVRGYFRNIYQTVYTILVGLRITLKLVSGSELEPVWDYYVKQFHYLGYQRLLGHRLKYLALISSLWSALFK